MTDRTSSPAASTLALLALGAQLLVSAALAQPRVVSPEARDDGAVVFRLHADGDPENVVVQVGGKDRPMTRGEGKLWSTTVDDLGPGIHEYAFRVDGTRMIDPANRRVKKWLTLASLVEIPADPPALTERQNVPHGVVVHAVYASESVGGQRPIVLYLPPGYDPAAERKYPLLLLFHGFGDDETAWTEVGRAHLIADNLIAQGKIEPTVIAMPFGHPVALDQNSRTPEYWQRNDASFRADVLDDLLPFLEERFDVSEKAADRAVAGLSMGGGHALSVGLTHPEKFSAVAAFSAAAPQLETEELVLAFPALKGPDPAANSLKLLWIPIGEGDFLLERNRKFVGQLEDQGVRHAYREGPGGHEWRLWREYLPEFLVQAFPAQ